MTGFQIEGSTVSNSTQPLALGFSPYLQATCKVTPADILLLGKYEVRELINESTEYSTLFNTS